MSNPEPVLEYCIVDATDLDEFELRIDEMIEAGFEPHGPPIINEGGSGDAWWRGYQAMIKRTITPSAAMRSD